MIPWRLVQRANLPKPKGLAIGFLIGRQVDALLRISLPDWSIVVTDQAPLSVTSKDLQDARMIARLDVDAPIGLFGFSAGCQSVRTILLANLIKQNSGPVWVAVFDGTHGSVPPLDWQVEIWKAYAERARKGEVRFVATCTSMTYTKDIPLGQPGRATPTREILEAVIGQALGSYDPVEDHGLSVERYPSSACDAIAHIHQENVVMPTMLGRYISNQETDATPIHPDEQPFKIRCLAWCEAELEAGVKEDPPHSNTGPRIKDYFATPQFMRNSKPIKIESGAWCAAAQCMAEHECHTEADPEYTARLSGIELIQDAKDTGRFYTGEPEIGDLAFFKRPGEAWETHTARVKMKMKDTTGTRYGGFVTVAGNENDGWLNTTHDANDPNLIGFASR